MTADFWVKHDLGYRLFSQFCDFTDWNNILKCIAFHLRSADARGSRELLDIGAGTGHNTLAVLELLLALESRRHALTVVEPSTIATARLRNILLPYSEGGFLTRLVMHSRELGDHKFDGILLLHSSYYIAQFDDFCESLYESHLRQSGILVVVALSRSSPFFLGQPPLYNNVAEDVHTLAQRRGWDVEMFNCPSRFRFPRSLKLTDSSFRHLYKFCANGSRLPYGEFKRLFYKFLVVEAPQEVDLADRLIRIHKQ